MKKKSDSGLWRTLWCCSIRKNLKNIEAFETNSVLSHQIAPFLKLVKIDFMNFLHFLRITEYCGAASRSYLLLLLRKIVIMMMYSYSERQIYRFSPIIWEIFSPSSSKISGLTHMYVQAIGILVILERWYWKKNLSNFVHSNLSVIIYTM